MTREPQAAPDHSGSGRAALDHEHARFRAWLFDQALPFWADKGVEADQGFVERFTPAGEPTVEPRRARVVGRQIYAFAAAERLAWTGPARRVQVQGLGFLTTRFLTADGGVISTTTPEGAPLGTAFDLYDHAFVLFGLAAHAGAAGRAADLGALAERILARMKAGWKHPVAGFEEANPRSLPLKANPHMHMFEAALAWREVAPAPVFDALADEIAELCLARFLDPATGALREFFDGDWRPADGSALSIVEPGHQYEWAWLLIRWGLWRGRPDAVAAARRLIAIAEGRGVDPVRDLAVNELNADLSPRDQLARLWPQTERIKAAIALARVAATPAEADAAFALAARAVRGLMRFFDHPLPGLWFEHIDESGAPKREPARASSLYHIVCAFSEIAAGDRPQGLDRRP